MLNLTDNHVKPPKNGIPAMNVVFNFKAKKRITGFLAVSFVIFIALMFFPWTQNVQGDGFVTTLKPEQRPQTIHTTIAGRVEKWYVQEGDFVEKGDTIAFLSEIKDDYFDPELLSRTDAQVDAKESAVEGYLGKIDALESQIEALNASMGLKMEQAENKIQQAHLKVTADSIDLAATQIDYNTSLIQFKRAEDLFEEGLLSLLDLEKLNIDLQAKQADLVGAETQLLTSRNELAISTLDLSALQAEYLDKIAKAESDKFSTFTDKFATKEGIIKLEVQYENYLKRSSFYFITAPQDCYITKALVTGLGETVKEGDPLVSIIPSEYELAVEMYVMPLDLPLMQVGEHVRLQFDGWPAIVFSGWPNTSFGTFGGTIVAIDNMTSNNGLYRILVAEDPNDVPWPEALRVGSGVNAMALLNDVPVWYELWRQFNGFPQDFYNSPDEENKDPQAKK